MNLPNYLMIFFCLFLYLIINPADSRCQKSFECGKLGSLVFPLSHVDNPTCGVFMVEDCESDPRIQLEAVGRWYEILRTDDSQNSLFIRDPEIQMVLNDKICFAFNIISLPKSPHSSFRVTPNAVFISVSLVHILIKKFKVYLQNSIWKKGVSWKDICIYMVMI